MRLKRIEAVRFGRLLDCTLGEFGAGLTVVRGPNEAGKTTFTHLVRYVLYGFPTAGSKQQPPFLSVAGEREGRLVFADDDGEWVITRTHGPHGGPVAVHAVGTADERQGLEDDLTRGVSPAEYRVVFGFGLDELAEIDRERGSENDIVSRLYAAGAGITLSPTDVGAEIDKRAAEIFAPRASKPAINSLLSEMRTVRAEIRRLEDDADSVVGATEELHGLISKVESAKEARDISAAHSRKLQFDLERVQTLTKESDDLGRQLAETRAGMTAAERERDGHRPDTDVLSAEAEIAPLLAEVSAARERQDRIAQSRAECRTLEGEIGSLLGRLGITQAVADSADLSPESVTGIERWRDRLNRLAVDEDRAAQAAGRAQDAAAQASGETTLPRESAAARGSTPRWPIVAAGVIGLSGIALALASIANGQSLGIVAGTVALLAAVVLFFALRTAGSLSGTGARDSGEIARETARAGELAKLELERARKEHASARAEWSEWAEQRGFGSATADPAAAAILRDELKTLRAKQDRLEATQRGIETDTEAQKRLAGQMWEAAKTFMNGDAPTEDTLLEFASRLTERIESATATDALRTEAQTAIDAVRQRLEGLAEQQKRAASEIEVVLEEHGAADNGQLSSLTDSAEEEAAKKREEYESLSTRRTELETTLGAEGREREMIENRQIEVGLRQRLDTLSAEYVVLALASRLLDEARRRYERERQPDVIRTAAEVFARITDGRYERLALPLGDGAMTVLDAASQAKETAHLSRGTAEALYLALRIALIEQMGSIGESLPIIMDDIFVNFDAERRRGAVEAVAGLARSRQVIVFTCHEQTARLLVEVEPDIIQLSLDRC